MTIEAVRPKSLADYLEAMTKAVFRAGISWDVVEAKWGGMREVFARFDPEKVAAFTPADVERIARDTRVIRNHKKIEAVVYNAGELIVTDRDFGGMDEYLRSFADNDALVSDLRARFHFMGESTAHFFLWGIGFNPEAQNAWGEKHFAGRTWAGHHRRAHG